MPFDTLIGQDRSIRILKGVLEKGTVAHCYLFLGEAGVGKTLAAREFAKALLCRESKSDNCGVCASCKKIEAGQHPDVFDVGGEERQIKIDQIRALEEALSRKAFEGGLKVAIIREAETMNPAAGNAFLKTLEEPPAESIIILVSSRPDLLPDTIRSRAQVVRFYPLSKPALERILSRHPDLGQKEVRMALAEGRLKSALSPDLCADRDAFLQNFQLALRDGVDADQLWKEREQMDEWFDWAITWLRDGLVYSCTGNVRLLANPDREPELRRLSAQASPRDLARTLDTLFRIRDLLRFNLNKNLTFQHTLLQLKTVFS